ncbi:hypothetical protein B0H19DRAFT_1164614 [Mycena capillaripes]|nr:hypothetical protein B0H19DRAFT_1164614 [Mycena capillaripes]
MSTRASRKRRRSQAFPEEDTEEPSVSDGTAPKYVESTGQDRLDKEREVWDAFKDEHVEVFDLSSSLWRRFDLVRELDQQDGRTTASLLDAFMKYVKFRKAIAQPPPTVVPPTTETETVEKTEPTMKDSEMPQAEDSEMPQASDSEMPPVPIDDTTIASDEPTTPANGASSSSIHPPASPPQSAPADQLSSREMLAAIAKFSEASIRDREEKVNLTLAACDSVERSIRLIDQAIHEQEHAISLGARSGTRLAPILLPELTVPKWTKPVRVTLSPDLDDALGGSQDKAPAQSNRRKKSKKSRKKDPLPAEATVPLPRPKPPVIPNADPNERRYCYCDQVSFGEMIACDDPRCKHEWFHLTCTNLTAAPEGRKKWFCDDCMLRKNQKRNR